MEKVVRHSKLEPSSNELIKSVIADFETVQGRAAVQEALRKGFAGAKPADVCPALAHALFGIDSLRLF
jgi:hypothetical protein